MSSTCAWPCTQTHHTYLHTTAKRGSGARGTTSSASRTTSVIFLRYCWIVRQPPHILLSSARKCWILTTVITTSNGEMLSVPKAGTLSAQLSYAAGALWQESMRVCHVAMLLPCREVVAVCDHIGNATPRTGLLKVLAIELVVKMSFPCYSVRSAPGRRSHRPRCIHVSKTPKTEPRNLTCVASIRAIR